MRTYYPSVYPKWANCTECTGRMPYRVGSFVCERCMSSRATYSDDDLICEAPSGCTRTVGRDEHLCHVHQAIADGLPPPLAPGHLAYALDRLPADAVTGARSASSAAQRSCVARDAGNHDRCTGAGTCARRA
jgi:hypothetical protein